MWFSFAGNFILFLTGLFIFLRLNRNRSIDAFQLFFLFTALAAIFGGFGHLDIISEYWGRILLFVSRVFSLFSLLAIASGVSNLFDRKNAVLGVDVWLLLFIICLVQLVLKNNFLPVMLYGIASLGMYVHYKFWQIFSTHRSLSVPMIIGIIFQILAAIVFALNSSFSEFNTADMSHILMSIGLVFMYKSIFNFYHTNVPNIHHISV
jgi:hypothetical protein